MTDKDIIEYKKFLKETFKKGDKEIEYLTTKIDGVNFTIIYYYLDFSKIKYIILYPSGYYKNGTFDFDIEHDTFTSYMYRKLLIDISNFK